MTSLIVLCTGVLLLVCSVAAVQSQAQPAPSLTLQQPSTA